MAKEYNYTKTLALFQELQNEQSDYMTEWKSISDWLLPGRGVFQTVNKPTKRRLTNPRVINTAAEDALYVLTSGMHGGLTSPSRPWFKLDWVDDNIKTVEPLKQWLQVCQDRLHAALHKSNFYSIINSFYIEYAGFGTGSIYVGEDTYTDKVPFRFELLTVGEYTYLLGVDGTPSVYFRTIFMTPLKFSERFPDEVPKDWEQKVKDNGAGIASSYVVILECVKKEALGDRPYTRTYFAMSAPWDDKQVKGEKKPIEVSGFFEFPYPTAMWSRIGSDESGLGLGSKVLQDIKRLQEMEKGILMATHKGLDPPVNVPARMKGKLNTLPGGRNYYANKDQTVTELYQLRFNIQDAEAVIARTEERIRRNFFNDIFLTASRDPNASPLKARQVEEQSQEKMLRLGPVIEPLQHTFYQPMIERCFNIMLRKEQFPPLPPELAQIAGDYSITLVSPLATAQRAVALSGVNSFLGFVGQVAGFDQTALDNVDVDETVRDYANITGVRLGILRPQDQVDAIRKQRAEAQAQERAKQEAVALAQIQGSMDAEKAGAMKAQAEAGTTLLEGQQMRAEMGDF